MSRTVGEFYLENIDKLIERLKEDPNSNRSDIADLKIARSLIAEILRGISTGEPAFVLSPDPLMDESELDPEHVVNVLRGMEDPVEIEPDGRYGDPDDWADESERQMPFEH